MPSLQLPLKSATDLPGVYFFPSRLISATQSAKEKKAEQKSSEVTVFTHSKLVSPVSGAKRVTKGVKCCEAQSKGLGTISHQVCELCLNKCLKLPIVGPRYNGTRQLL